MGRIGLGMNVFDASLQRLIELYEAGHRLVLALSGGKDSTICLELMVRAAEETGNLPVEACYMDEEVIYPPVTDYLMRVAEREEIDLLWMVPVNSWNVNAYSRSQPYFRSFDPLYEERWVRQPNPSSEFVEGGSMRDMVNLATYYTPGVEEGIIDLVQVTGIRALESPRRRLAIHSSKGHLTNRDKQSLVRWSRPIYDWSDKDVYLALKKFNWDYCTAYDDFLKAGLTQSQLRVGQPTNGIEGLPVLRAARSLWPDWFSRVCRRLDGVHQAVTYGINALRPDRHSSETWMECFQRLCLKSPVPWIAERSAQAMSRALKAHRKHSDLPFPEVTPCLLCPGNRFLGSWKNMVKALYNGDPAGYRVASLGLKMVDPNTVMGVPDIHYIQ